MAVRLTTCFLREDEHIRGRRGINHELRNRFGFSLIQAPLRSPLPLDKEFDVPAQRRHDPARPARPLETGVPLRHGLGSSHA